MKTYAFLSITFNSFRRRVDIVLTKNGIHDTFATIAQDVGFYVGWKQLHVLLSITFNSFCRRVNIMFTKDGIRTLVIIIIADPTQVDLLSWSYITQGFVASNVVQAKERSFCN
jgi:hypothetical protein